jgi:hypothetical protein
MPVPSAVISVPISSEDEHLVEARLLDVEDLALAAAGSPGSLRSRPCLAEPPAGIALDDEELALRRILLLAVGQLAGQRRRRRARPCGASVSRALRAASRRARGLDDLAGDRSCASAGCSSQVVAERLADDVLDDGRAPRRRPACPWSGEQNLGSGTFTDSTQVRPSRMSSPVGSTLCLLAQASLSSA